MSGTGKRGVRTGTTRSGCASSCRPGSRSATACRFHGPGYRPFGITAFAGREDSDLALWLPTVSAIVPGDSLADLGGALDILLGGRMHVTRDDVRRRLRPLLDPPIALVLLLDGEPKDPEALERVLA